MLKIKNFRKLFAIITSIVFLVSCDTFAANFTWIGQDGYWDDASNWDLGQVPDIGDDVKIENGNVIIDGTQYISTIDLEGGQLNITESGVLILQGIATGIRLRVLKIDYDGILLNEGHIFFLEIDAINLNNTFIYNDGLINNVEGGMIYMSGSSFKGINSRSGTQINNYGSIIMDGVKYGINSTGDFNNYGSIDISSEDYSFFIFRQFYNGSSATVNVDNYLICEGCDQMDNYGDMNFHTDQRVRWALIVDGLSTIHSTGRVVISGNYEIGIYVYRNGGELLNYGEIEVDLDSPSAVGIQNIRILTNYHDGNITCESYKGNNAYTSTGTVKNYGTWSFDTDQSGLDSYVSIDGNFRNEDTGKLYFEDELSLSSKSLIKNMGHMFLRSETKSPKVHGDILNLGSINNIDGKFFNVINESIIARPVLKQNTISNALEVNSFSNTTILDWYTNATGNTHAGTCDNNTNTFYPYNSTLSLNAVFVEIMINRSGAVERHEVKLLRNRNIARSLDEGGPLISTTSQDFDLTIYPNPTSEILFIKIRDAEFDSKLNARLIDLQGREIAKVKCGNECQMKIPENVINGTYFLSIDNGGMPQGSPQAIKVFRNE